jgi:glycosyltransferase involved in cell wall biosynthesis
VSPRVAVPPELAALAPTTGHGRVWASVLPPLAGHVRLRIRRPGPARPWRRAPDVWLLDGHAELPAVDAPVVVQVHEATWADPALRPLVSDELAERLERMVGAALRAAERVIVPSASARDELVRAYGLAGERVHAAHHGVDHGRFHPAAGAGRPLPDGVRAPYVLFVGVLHPRKGLRALRDAMARLDGRAQLVLVGAPAPDRADPAELLAELAGDLPGAPGSVVWRHGVGEDELAALMAGAAAFCLPSLWEGFGLPAAEAMACGTPVVVSDRGALPEVVGDAGLVVAPEAEPVAEALGRVLGDARLAADLGRRGRERAQAFTWERTAEAWAGALRAAAGTPS